MNSLSSGLGTFTQNYPLDRLVAKAEHLFDGLKEHALPKFQSGRYAEGFHMAFGVATELHLSVFAERLAREIVGGLDVIPLIGDRALRASLNGADMRERGEALRKVIERGSAIPGFMSSARSSAEREASWLELSLDPHEYTLPVARETLGAYMKDAADSLKKLQAQLADHSTLDDSLDPHETILCIKCAALMDTLRPNLSSFHSSGMQFGSMAMLLGPNKEPLEAKDLELAVAYTTQLALSIGTSNR